MPTIDFQQLAQINVALIQSMIDDLKYRLNYTNVMWELMRRFNPICSATGCVTLHREPNLLMQTNVPALALHGSNPLFNHTNLQLQQQRLELSKVAAKPLALK